MFDFIRRLLGAPRALDAVVDGAKSALDKLIYTKEEQADAEAKAVTEARSMVVDWMAQTKGQNIARRIIALGIVFTWLASWVLSLALRVCYIWWPSPELLATAKAVSEGVGDMMHTGVTMILGFYFAAPHMTRVVEAWAGKQATKLDRGPRSE